MANTLQIVSTVRRFSELHIDIEESCLWISYTQVNFPNPTPSTELQMGTDDTFAVMDND